MPLFDRPVLMWVTDRNRSDAPLPELARGISAAGVDIVQVRENGLDRLPAELLVRAIQSVVRASTAVVVNANLELARKLRVGVHLPEAGPSVTDARALLGTDALIGRSVHSSEAAASSSGASYLVAGHVFETESKQGRAPLGLDGFAAIVRSSPAPVLAIGGITPDRVAALMERGASGVAVMSPFSKLATAENVTAAYRLALEQSMTEPTSATITATINGKPVQLPAGTTIAAFLAGRELHERLVVVERNGEIIKRSTFPDTVVEEGDLLEIVHFVGGG
jgi:thiamine biosynthesis protein ThiS